MNHVYRKMKMFGNSRRLIRILLLEVLRFRLAIFFRKYQIYI